MKVWKSIQCNIAIKHKAGIAFSVLRQNIPNTTKKSNNCIVSKILSIKRLEL